jgi:cell division protein FtsA
MGSRERYLVGLDIGTSKVAAIVGEMRDDGSLEIIGIGVSESKGIRRGAVVNLEAAVDSIKHAVEEAELMAGVEVDTVHIAISGPHIKGFNSRGVIAVAGKNREITRDDVRRAIDAAKAVALPTGREILHVLPQDFVVDDQDGIGAPVGMTGARLEVNVHIVTGGTTATHNVVACVNRAGISVADTVIAQLAHARREGAWRGARRHRRRDDRPGDFRARQPVAHRSGRDRRRSLHQRHCRRPSHADSRWREAEAQVRVRAFVDRRRR